MPSSPLKRNIIANYLSVIWLAGLNFALIPVYLKLLGSDRWGIIAICITIQGFLTLLDAGLGQIMPRNVTLAHDNQSEEKKVFDLFAYSYLMLGAIGFVIAQFSITWLVRHWLNLPEKDIYTAEIALRLVLVQFLFQFANNAHTGFWNGKQQQVLANARQCFFTTFKHVMAISFILLWEPTVFSYLIPFAVISMLEWLLNRKLILNTFNTRAHTALTISDFKLLASQAGVLLFSVIVGMLTSQADRIILSSTLPVHTYGHYLIVASLGLAFFQLQYPLIRAFYPRIVRSLDEGQHPQLFPIMLGLFCLCIAPCIVTAIFSPWILHTWTGNAELAAEGSTPLRLILMAVALNCLYNLAYQFMLARNKGNLILKINVAILPVVFLVTLFTADQYGMNAGGIAWLCTSILQASAGLMWFFFYELKKNRI